MNIEETRDAANENESPVSAGRQRSESAARGASPNSDRPLKGSGDSDAAMNRDADRSFDHALHVATTLITKMNLGEITPEEALRSWRWFRTGVPEGSPMRDAAWSRG